MLITDKQDLDQTINHITTVVGIKYDGTFIKKGTKKVKVQMLRSLSNATNYNKHNRTLYVSPSDTRRYQKLKEFIQII